MTEVNLDGEHNINVIRRSPEICLSAWQIAYYTDLGLKYVVQNTTLMFVEFYLGGGGLEFFLVFFFFYCFLFVCCYIDIYRRFPLLYR